MNPHDLTRPRPEASTPARSSRFPFATAQEILLAPYALDDTPAADACSAQIMSHKVDYADLYFQYSRSESWSLEEGIVKSGSFNIDQGVGVRAVSGEKTAFAYSDDISLTALQSAAEATRAIARAGPGGQCAGGEARPRASICTSRTIRCRAWRTSDKVALLERVERYARSLDTRVTQVMAWLAGEYEVVLVARSDGVLAADVRPLVRAVGAGDRRAGRHAASRAARAAAGVSTTPISPTKCWRITRSKAVHQAVVNLDARPAPAGPMTVVLGPGWPGVLLHEAVGHGLEGDFNRKGTSAFSGRIGERVAAPGVTVVDDGTIAAAARLAQRRRRRQSDPAQRADRERRAARATCRTA